MWFGDLEAIGHKSGAQAISAALHLFPDITGAEIMRKPNKRAGVDSGFTLQFACASLWPGTTHHGRSVTDEQD